MGRTPEPLSIAELHRLYRVLDGDPLTPLWHVTTILGLRLSECLGLRWADVNWECVELTVAGQVQALAGATEHRNRTKGGRTRTIPLPPHLLKRLRHHSEAQREWAKAADWQEHGLVFASSVGTPIVPATWSVTSPATHPTGSRADARCPGSSAVRSGPGSRRRSCFTTCAIPAARCSTASEPPMP